MPDTTEPPAPVPRGSLALVCAALCALILGAAAWLLHGQYRIEQRGWRQRQSALIQERTALLRDWLSERADDAQYLARSPWIAPAAAGDPRARLLARQELTRLRARGSRAAVCLRLPGGETLSAAGGDSALCPARGTAGELIASGPKFGLRLAGRSPADTLLGVSVAGPDGAQVTLWASPAELFAQMTAQQEPYRTQTAVLLYRDAARGQAVALTPSRRRDNALPRLRVALNAPDRPEALAFSGKKTFGVMKDYAGREVLATAAPIPALGLGIVAKVDRAEALARFRQLAALQGAAALLLAAAICGLIWTFWKGRQRAWLAERLESERRYRQLFENMKSAVAVWEPAANEAGFALEDVNPAGLRLSALASRAEAKGRPPAEVFPGLAIEPLLPVMRRVAGTEQ
ncbi:MAG: hypothetical protein PHF00_04405, partial [Elusimicrobia bacterium]|nr:hypothetical protein [Elusimicrobiota bacterium]